MECVRRSVNHGKSARKEGQYRTIRHSVRNDLQPLGAHEASLILSATGFVGVTTESVAEQDSAPLKELRNAADVVHA
jgi:hypothetical protein